MKRGWCWAATPAAGGGQPASVRCFGEAEPDVARFLTAALAEADVVLLDQHLVFEETYYGTDLAAYLLQHGFQGLVCAQPQCARGGGGRYGQCVS